MLRAFVFLPGRPGFADAHQLQNIIVVLLKQSQKGITFRRESQKLIFDFFGRYVQFVQLNILVDMDQRGSYTVEQRIDLECLGAASRCFPFFYTPQCGIYILLDAKTGFLPTNRNTTKNRNFAIFDDPVLRKIGF